MPLPFGIQVKGVIVGILLALFVWPFIQGRFLSRPAAAD